MTWRQKMHDGTGISQAEIAVWTEMQKRGLHPDAHHRVCLKSTVPDYFFKLNVREGHNFEALAVYLDGEDVHKDLEKDELIVTQLGRRRVKALRFRYRGKLAQCRVQEIVDEVENVLNREDRERARVREGRGELK